MLIRVEKLPAGEHTKKWVKLTGGTQFKNVGMSAEVGYSTVANTEPTEFTGELVGKGGLTETGRGDVYVVRDAYFSYEFIPVA